MNEALFAELLVALLISFFIYKLLLGPKVSSRKMIRHIETGISPISNDNVSAKIKNLINSGHKIQAVKVVRELTGLGLKDAKEYVEQVEKGQEPAINIIIPAAVKLENQFDPQILSLIKEGKKLEAIKLIRLKTNLGLKDAKDYVESLE